MGTVELTNAKAAFERSLHICEATLGSNHPDMASVVNNLGSLLLDLGDLAGAKAAFEQALRIFKRSLPAEYPKIKIVQANQKADNHLRLEMDQIMRSILVSGIR